MATDPKSGVPRPFDVSTIERLIDLMAQHDLSEISLAEGEQRIRLRKGFPLAQAPGTYIPGTPAPAVATGSPSAAPPPGANTPGSPISKLLEIKSPMVGTYYSKATPDKPDYVSVGSKVTANTVVC